MTAVGWARSPAPLSPSRPMRRSGARGRGNSLIASSRSALAEIRPQRFDEDKLGIGALPQQEIADALLAAGTDEEIGIGHAGGEELTTTAASRRCRSPRARRAATSCGERARRRSDLGAAAIAQRDDQR